MQRSGATAGVAETLVHGFCGELGAVCAGLVLDGPSGLEISAGDPVLALGIANGAAVSAAHRRAPRVLVAEAGDPGCPAGLGLVAAVRVPVSGGGEPVLFAGLRAARPAGAIAVLLPGYAAAVGRRLDQLAITPCVAATPGDEAVVITDECLPDRPIVHACHACSRLTGYRPAELIGRNPRVLQGADRDQPARWRILGALDEGMPVSARLRNYGRDGTAFPARLELAPVRGEDGRITHWTGLLRRADGAAVSRGQVDRMTAEAVHALELSAVGKLVVDRATGVVRFANAVAARMLGAPANALIGREAPFAVLRDGRVRLQPGHGPPGAAEMTCRSVAWGRWPAWLVTLFDVTVGDGLRPDPVTGAPVRDDYPAPVVWSRPDASIAHVTAATADLFGYSREELTALTPGHLDAGGLVEGDAWALLIFHDILSGLSAGRGRRGKARGGSVASPHDRRATPTRRPRPAPTGSHCAAGWRRCARSTCRQHAFARAPCQPTAQWL